jgi:hypothetical protein
MQLIAYPISIIALFFTNIVVGAILLALIRGPKGHRGSWQFDPDPRYFFIDRIAQGLTKFSTSIIWLIRKICGRFWVREGRLIDDRVPPLDARSS